MFPFILFCLCITNHFNVFHSHTEIRSFADGMECIFNFLWGFNYFNFTFYSGFNASRDFSHFARVSNWERRMRSTQVLNTFCAKSKQFMAFFSSPPGLIYELRSRNPFTASSWHWRLPLNVHGKSIVILIRLQNAATFRWYYPKLTKHKVE